jgi:hypothetical protein
MGCEQTSQSRAYSTDPLLQFWKPVEGKAKDQASQLIAYAEPAIPEFADRAGLAKSNPGTFETREHTRPTLDTEPTSNRVVEAEPVSRKKVSTQNDLFGHDDSYRWLIGILEKDSEGRSVLRYVPESESASGEGTVVLDQAAIAKFEAGDVLFVEGELAVPAKTGAPMSHQAPSYNLKNVKLLKKSR